MIFLILIFGFLLRLISLDQSFWLDEATSATVVRDLGFREIITKFAPGDFHPPFYYLILKAWTQLFGLNEVSARLLSVLAGLGTIYLMYLIGKEIFNKKVGVFGAVLLAISPLHIYYSQEARMYAPATFFVALAVFSFVKTLKGGRVGYWLLFGLSIALAAATDYVPLFILPVFWLYGIISKQNQFWWKKFIASHIILVIVAILWLPIFTHQYISGTNVATTSPSWWKILGLTSIKNLALVAVKFTIGRISFDNKILYALIVAGTSSIFAYPLIRSIKALKKIRLLWLWFLFPTIFAAIVGLKISIFSYFRLLFCLPAFFLLVASGLGYLKPNIRKVTFLTLLLINLLASGYYLFNPRFHRENWRGLVNFVEGQKNRNSITLFVAPSQMEAYKYYSPDATIAGPEGLKKGFDQVWLMRYVQPVFDPEDALRQRMEKAGYVKEAEYDFNGVVVWKYNR